MWITLPSKKYLPEMPVVVRERVDARIAAAKPPGEQVDRQRKAVHFGEERHQKSREHPEGSPVTLRPRAREAEGENYEDCRVDDDQQPEAVVRGTRIHYLSSSERSPWSPGVFSESPLLCPWCMNRCIKGHKSNNTNGRTPKT